MHRWRFAGFLNRRFIRNAAIVYGLLVVVVFWASSRRLLVGDLRPAFNSVGVNLPYVGVSCCAHENGVHFQVHSMPSFARPTLRFGYFGPGSNYRFGAVIRCLGFQAAVLTSRVVDVDVEYSPHAAVAVPWWFLIVGSGWRAGKYLGLTPILLPWLRCRGASHRAAALTAVGAAGVCLALNLTPAAYGDAERRLPLVAHFTTTEFLIDPRIVAHPLRQQREVMLEFGFPFAFYRLSALKPEQPQIFSKETGWHPDILLEDLLIAALSVLSAVAAANLITRRSRRGAATLPPQSSPAGTRD